MMSFLGALLLTGVVVLVVGGVLYWLLNAMTDGNGIGSSFWSGAIWVVFCAAVSLFPLAIMLCIAEGEGGAWAKMGYIFEAAISIIPSVLSKPSVWEHIIVFAPMIVGGFVPIYRWYEYDDVSIRTPFLCIGVSSVVLVVAAIAWGLFDGTGVVVGTILLIAFGSAGATIVIKIID